MSARGNLTALVASLTVILENFSCSARFISVLTLISFVSTKVTLRLFMNFANFRGTSAFGAGKNKAVSV